MKTITHTIQDEMGLHARPVGQIVKFLKPFSSTITVACGEKSCDMKKLMALMSLGIKQGATVEISIEGADEAECAQAFEAFLQENGI